MAFTQKFEKKIEYFVNSLPGQFIIGGTTVASISALSNIVGDTLLAGIIASIPIGMPSTIFIKGKNVKSYTWNLLVMTSVLVLATISNYILINHMEYDKYYAVGISMSVWALLGVIYYFVDKYIFLEGK